MTTPPERPPFNQHASRCTATSKRSGSQCKNAALKDRRTCRMHGGQSPAGPASATYQHGLRSGFRNLLPAKLRDVYDAARENPELFEHKADLLLYEVRFNELAATVYGEGGAVDPDLALDTFERVDAAIRAGNPQALAVALASHKAALDAGRSRDVVWEKLLALSAQRRRSLVAYTRAQTAAERSITVERFDFILRFIEAALLRHVTDRQVLRALVADLAPVFTPGQSPAGPTAQA